MHKLYTTLRRVVSNAMLSINQEAYKKLKYKQPDDISFNELVKTTLEPELFLIKELVSDQSVVFDIGSNVGAYLYAFEKIVQPGNIYGFEPNQNLFLNLKKLFGKINLLNIAISDVSENAELKIPIINNVAYEARGTLNLDFKEIDENDFTLINIKKESLDNYVLKNGISKLDFIKIDVEGHEFQILKGAINTLKQFKPTLLIEIEQRHHKFPISQIDDFLLELGYSKYFFLKKENRILPGKEFNAALHQGIDTFKTESYVNNFIFIPEDKVNNKNFELDKWHF